MQNDQNVKLMVGFVVSAFPCQEITGTRLNPLWGDDGCICKKFQQLTAKAKALTWKLGSRRRNLTQVTRTAETMRQQAVRS